ncbi:ABC transporter ATP-binding protein [Oceanibacterium hippocampi]|uniref:High-affinity branched-chain amino acid transport ATP-binding protein LivF n=1 Tax=Oceanibacterium hippocampi TaxID=745714 RepID=A0A1Y5TRN1_9PROT|nr:ABC transporter ATP-binding protein [Oceanibacterium hippocampi]SLN70447.1 High-affinity branched-chain amino acid transport ATP-binding protein LivF [Oceanibacterium hippocampi]
MSLLAFDHVDACYGAARILNDVSFNVDAGERVAVLGRNGVGKTTVVNTLCGGTTIRAGEVRINDRGHTDLPHYLAARSGIATVLQGRGILPNLTIEENLLLGASVGRKGPWSLEAVYGLFPILRERSTNMGLGLSGGQQQMLAIGRALMANPDLLVLDEPSEGLAPVIVDELAELFNRLGRDGTAIMLIEQNVGLIQRVAERYYVLSKGQVIESGSLEGMSTEQLQRHIAI